MCSSLSAPKAGDLVIRTDSGRGVGASEQYVITMWPDLPRIVGGPYVTYAEALDQAKRLVRARDEGLIWRADSDDVASARFTVQVWE
jgi:hypothetical protein